MKYQLLKNEKTKEIFIGFLVSACVILTIFFKLIFGLDVVYTHLFYIPISLSAFWWKKKGFLVSVILSIQLIFFEIIINKGALLLNDILRCGMFIFVSLFIITIKSILDKQEQNIKINDATIKAVFLAAPVGINLINDRKFQWCNDIMYYITGYKREELVGKPTRILYPSEEEYVKAGVVFEKELSEKGFVEIETKWIRKDGKIIDIYKRLTPLDPEDRSKGFITTIMDITSKKQAQEQLSENLEYFAHLIDHIRNPLAIISGYAQFEIENQNTKERILRQVDRIEKIIKQLDKGWLDTEDTRKFLGNY